MSTLEMSAFTAPLAEVKADGQGLFAALVSVFGNTDRNNDRVMPGAFKRTIERWQQSGKPIPVILSHSHGEPGDYIGSVNPADMRETPEGLLVAGKLFMDQPRAREVFDLMKKDLITAWSFAFQSVKDRMGEDGVRELQDLDLFEVGPTLIGANPEAQTLVLKSVGVEEKSPPWHIESREGEFCVVKDEDGETVACHATRGEAEAQLAALYANEASVEVETKAGRAISAATAARLRKIREVLNGEIDELLGDTEVDVADEASAHVRDELEKVGMFLAERGR